MVDLDIYLEGHAHRIGTLAAAHLHRGISENANPHINRERRLVVEHRPCRLFEAPPTPR